MDKERLLSKKEQFELTFLRLLYTHDTLTFSQLGKLLPCCERTVKNTFYNIQERFKQEIADGLLQLTMSPLAITLIKNNRVNLDYFLNRYIAQSTIFNILLAFQAETKVKSDKLTYSLGISQSKLYKCLQKINEFLQEFDLTIKNNQLQGDELQIRHFYFQLFWHSTIHHDLTIQQVNPMFLEVATILEEKFETTLSASNKQKLFLWLQISTQRGAKKSVATSLPNFEKRFAYLDTADNLQTFKQLYSDTLKNNYLSKSFEARCLFLACLALAILPAEKLFTEPAHTFTSELIQGYRDIFATATIAPLHNNKELFFAHLTTLCRQHFLFQGTFTQQTGSGISRETSHSQEKVHHYLSEQFKQFTNNYFKSQHLLIEKKAFVLNFQKLFDTYINGQYPPLKIGFLSADLLINQEYSLHVLENILGLEFNLSIELFQGTHTYDLVISDFYDEQLTKLSQPLYTLSGTDLIQDIVFIRGQLGQLLNH